VFDPGAPASFPGLTSGYLPSSSLTYNVGNKVMLHGFMYVGKNLSNTGGGGNGTFIGSVYVEGTVSLNSNSNATIYHDAAVAEEIETLGASLYRESWEEESREFPTGL
jgi:hypothetical protein